MYDIAQFISGISKGGEAAAGMTPYCPLQLALGSMHFPALSFTHSSSYGPFFMLEPLIPRDFKNFRVDDPD